MSEQFGRLFKSPDREGNLGAERDHLFSSEGDSLGIAAPGQPLVQPAQLLIDVLDPPAEPIAIRHHGLTLMGGGPTWQHDTD